jgi:tetratricopeptide (TPR) repeat protein
MPLIAGVDHGRRRGPFLSSLELLALAGIVSALLVLLFPGSDFENPVHLARPDDLSMAYLRMLLRAHPEDAEARLLLTQQQKALGRLEDAHESLAMLRPRSAEMAARVEVVALSLDRARLAALPLDDPQRPELLRETHAAAKRLISRTGKIAEIADLADFLLQVGDPAEASVAYRRLATLDKPRRIEWLEKAARWSEAAGQPGQAARIYAEASLSVSGGRHPAARPGAGQAAGTAADMPKDLKEGARLGRLALRALVAANEGKAGLAVARPIVELFPDDLELLELAVRMAVAAGDLNIARRWGEQRVIAAGSSDQALAEQVDIHMKAGDPEGALRVARVQLQRAPDDVRLRRQVAQLARWSGLAEEALEHYAWLAHRGFEDARLTSLELARALSDSDREVEMLELSLRRVRRMAAPPLNATGASSSRAPPPSTVDEVPLRRPRALTGGGIPARRRPLSDASFSVRRRAQAPAEKPAATVKSAVTERPAGTAKPAATQTPAATDKPAATEKPAAVNSLAGPRVPRLAASDQALVELVALADALEVRGQPERAITALDSLRFNFAERPEYWSRLARLYENIGQLERALACHEQLSRLKAMTLDDSVRQAQLLWRLQRPDAALTRLVALRGQARETDRGYFSLLGDLAWRLEENVLAAEAYGALWKTQKRQEIAERLYRALEAIGRRAEAVDVAEEAYERLGQSGFLVVAVDMAIRSGNQARARALFEKVKGKEAEFARESHFWFQRAQLHAHENRPSEAERDFQRVVRIDPRSGEAHNEWLTLAVRVQDRSMARRALDSWGPAVEKNEDAWPLLADAYTLIGNAAKAEHFTSLMRVARVRERAASGRPLTPDEQLEEAIERRDMVAVEQRLASHGRSISLPMRVAALRELGRDWDAWRLLEAAGLTDDKRLIASEDAAALVTDVRDLREQHLSGAWAWGRVDQLGPLEVRDAGARFELRARALLFGMELGVSELWALPATKLLPHGRREQRARASVKLRERIGATSLRAGAAFLPEGFRPFFQAEQLISIRDGKFELRALASFNEVPNHSPLLRTAGVRDGLDADATLVLGRYFELVAGSSWNRFSTRSRGFLTTEIAGRGEMAFRFPIGGAFIRPRVDGNANSVPPVIEKPADLTPFLTQRENPEDLLALEYSTAGVGLSLGSTQWDVGEGRGPHVSLRYHLDGWTGFLWPAAKLSYSVQAGLGLVFAQHQELALSGFYSTDRRSAAGERWASATLNYTLRWFR